ncbi:MAG: zinc ribbon domain-containing protein [Oscillospiraceae bacterium]
MKRYYRKEETPLKFHKVYRHFLLPVSILIMLNRMVTAIAGLTYSYWLYGVNIAGYIIALSLLITGFVGFFRWRAYAWYAIMSYLCFYVVYNLYDVIVYAVYMPAQTAVAVGQLIGALLYAGLVGIYYLKRRPLFFGGVAQSGGADTSGAGDFGGSQQRGTGNPPRAGYCPQCGRALPDGSVFCPYCGEKLNRDVPI